MTHTALIIDDEPDILELLEITLERMGVKAHKSPNLTNARTKLQENQYDFCLTDMRLPDGNGIDLVKELQTDYPNLPVAVFTAHGNMDTAVEAMKAGAFDFITKPVDLELLRQLVNTALSMSKPTTNSPINDDLIKGQAESVKVLRKKITKLARSQAPVFISGESGSGKELVARSIHNHGPRAESPFIAVNCGAIPTDLMESEFFGHKKGTFTGAHQDKKGLFQAANGGTLFLDEVADLPLDMQVKLLRAIQEKAIRMVGDAKEIKIDVRILSATHKNLANAVSNGDFRSDLYYRINVIEIDVPPLRDRKGDIQLLAEFFLEKFAEEMQCNPAQLQKNALTTLEQYTFPGNVRELENILERAYTLCDGDIITIDDLQLNRKNEPPSQQPKSTPSDINVAEIQNLDEYLADIERDILVNALEQNRWNRTATAKSLGITFRSLRYRLKKLGLEED
ncbi:sigma-54-dependent transcriptional regulator [Marinibactrum halimedae]|uniref:Type 4 fimbriae expression regulatory protein PilR n=1 Tax=Marinibactrum halimedae TaxID=1444977 RepID=A0AA37TDN6_9GAMM|nr:sigma-54 dependent transcriptional regulator [Marinibactrum halimedae]MCD9460241.1 sigma-54 dependent transcriptional regulator [Marinibactrum halimedae]GLS27925.1 type 4 fimbriae expression regulatory protein PilR [Marinibactrum halimedae]